MMTHDKTRTAVYAVNTRPLLLPSLFDRAYAAASPERRAKVDRYRKEEAKRQSLGAEMLLRYALAEAGLKEFPERLKIGRYGKPYLPGGELYFNLSHSEQWVLCAVSDAEVGCDIEKIRPIKIRTARRFAPEEYEDILACGGEETQTERFFRYWTLKESVMKATGFGMRLPLDKFCITLEPQLSLAQNADPRSFCLKEFDGIEEFRAALCAAGDVSDAELTVVDFHELLRVAAPWQD